MIGQVYMQQYYTVLVISAQLFKDAVLIAFLARLWGAYAILVVLSFVCCRLWVICVEK